MNKDFLNNNEHIIKLTDNNLLMNVMLIAVCHEFVEHLEGNGWVISKQ